MPRAPRYSKNERTLNRELARVTRRLQQSEEKRDAVLERVVDQLTQDRKQQARRARQAEQAARQALALVCQARADLAEQDRARQAELVRRPSVHQAAAVCIFTVVVRLLFL